MFTSAYFFIHLPLKHSFYRQIEEIKPSVYMGFFDMSKIQFLQKNKPKGAIKMTKKLNGTKQTKQSESKKAQELLDSKNPLRLSLDQIISEDVNYNELITVTFDDGRFCEVYKKFRPSSIDKLIVDFLNFLADYEKTGTKINEKDTQDFINLHIIQHFSTLVGEFPKNITQKLDIFNKMLDNNLIKKTFLAFDENELVKVYDTMTEKFKLVQKLFSEDPTLKDRLEAEVKANETENNKEGE